MKNNSIQRMTWLAVMALGLAGSSLQAQKPAGPQGAFASDVSGLSDKFSGLAKVLDGKFDYRPGQGVRSTGEVLNMIVMENGMLAGLLTGAAPGARPAPITDSAKLQEALKASYASLKTAIEGVSDSDLNAMVKLFGRDTPKGAATMSLLSDQHEHLGQLIAYARVNGIVPPWSK